MQTKEKNYFPMGLGVDKAKYTMYAGPKKSNQEYSRKQMAFVLNCSLDLHNLEINNVSVIKSCKNLLLPYLI